jgi:hypothetical protein
MRVLIFLIEQLSNGRRREGDRKGKGRMSDLQAPRRREGDRKGKCRMSFFALARISIPYKGKVAANITFKYEWCMGFHLLLAACVLQV